MKISPEGPWYRHDMEYFRMEHIYKVYDLYRTVSIPNWLITQWGNRIPHLSIVHRNVSDVWRRDV